MAEYDLVIRGGTLVDGTGLQRYEADLAVKDGRVAKISGKIKGGGAKELDASGCIVAPGAIDLHTHYDGQLNWDPYASLSSWFGVTSLTIGMCGFGFAPTRPEDRDLNMRMMNRIEAIPLDAMRLGMRWDWETYPEYLDSLDRQGLGLNVASLFPFSPLRGYVLGMLPARERRSVTDAELNQMKQLFYEGMKAGAFGFAADMSAEDHPEDGGFLPSHVASKEEYFGLAEVLGEFGVGHIGYDMGDIPFMHERKEQHELMTQMMRLSGRQLHVNGVLGSGAEESRAWVKWARSEGLPVVCQSSIVFPHHIFKLADYNLFDIYPNWVQPLVGSAEERAAKLRSPDTRAAMKQDVERYRHPRTNYSRLEVVEVVREANRKYEGMCLEELGECQQKHPLDAFLDLALEEGLQTVFRIPAGGVGTMEKVADRLKSPSTHISFSDGGAHIKFRTISHWPVFCLMEMVRDRELITLEEAHYKMSAFPAWFADFKDRGTLRTGSWADIMVYDLEKLGLLYDKITYATDFPGGDRRVVQWPTGMRYIMTNGTVTFEENKCTGALPGKLLRSYDMIS